ncbi:MAG: EamA family transporter [Candidatus Nanopelagicales bacterium]
MNRIPPWLLAVTSILSVQLSSALAVGLFPIVGPTGTAWLRLTAGALIFIAITRPPLRSVRREDLPALVGLGVTTGLVTMSFLAAIDRIPLGTAVAIEFLGPLTVAALRSHNRRALAWPALALAGVLLLTEPWHGEVNAAGLLFAAVAAVGWATYIVLTQHVGDRFSGISGLSITVPIAALTATPFGMVQAAGNLSGGVILAAIGLAILLPVLPLALEMIALREMTPTAFGTLMALEPAFAVLLGALVLHQTPAPPQILGIVLVVLAGAGAQRGGRRVHELELVD